MYGALTGLSKQMVAQRHGTETLKKWRRGYDTRPPPISSFSGIYPGDVFIVILINDISVNGIFINDILINGILINDILINGIWINDISVNGILINGISVNGILINMLIKDILINDISVNGILINMLIKDILINDMSILQFVIIWWGALCYSTMCDENLWFAWNEMK